MQRPHRRHDISDRIREFPNPHLPGRAGVRGVTTRDNRLLLNAIFWILRTETPWKDLSPDYDDWKNTHRRLCCWRHAGIWKQLLEFFISYPDFEWLMIDARHVKIHQHATGHTVETRIWDAQKVTQLKDTSCRGCAWYVCQNFYTTGKV